ncbi:MAG: hypothetical protein Q9194_001007 [Teloschistes cf. exilis]
MRRLFWSLLAALHIAGSDKEQAIARKWLQDFNTDTIPRNLCEISFSRSSGPGGQNVNKVNSKATLRVSTSDLFRLVPSPLHADIRASPYYAERSGFLVIQADSNRKQTGNVDACFTKLQNLILAAGRNSVECETSPEQAEKVRRLYAKFHLSHVVCSLTLHSRKADNEARLRAKKRHSGKKSARRGPSGSGL